MLSIKLMLYLYTMITLHNNTEFVSGVINTVFYNENQSSLKVLSNYCEEIKIECDRLFDDYIILAYSKEKGLEPITRKISKKDLTIEKLYSEAYDMYYELYDAFRYEELG